MRRRRGQAARAGSEGDDGGSGRHAEPSGLRLSGRLRLPGLGGGLRGQRVVLGLQ